MSMALSGGKPRLAHWLAAMGLSPIDLAILAKLPKCLIAGCKFVMVNNINKSFENSKQYVCFTKENKRVNFMFMKDEIKRVQQQFQSLGMSAPEFQRAAGIQSQHWNNWKSRGIPKDKLQAVSAIIKKPVDWILTGKEEINEKAIERNAIWLGSLDLWDNETPLGEDEVALPFFREVKLAAGNGLTSEVQENHGAKLRFAKSTLKRKGVSADQAACVMVAGNSMEPVLLDGSTVGIDTSKTDIINGKMYAIDHNGELRVKLVYTLPGGGLRLRSYNIDEYPDEPYQDASCLRILGQVFWYSVLL